jgi:hypothetical protein
MVLSDGVLIPAYKFDQNSARLMGLEAYLGLPSASPGLATLAKYIYVG